MAAWRASLRSEPFAYYLLAMEVKGRTRLGQRGLPLCRLALIAVLAIGGCGGDSDNDGACGTLRLKLRECGLLSEGTDDCDQVPAGSGVEVECLVDCLAAAECNSISSVLCSVDPEQTSALQQLGACIDDCAERFGFRCVDGASVPSSFQCDGEPDCVDASDEVGCEGFACGNGEQVLVSDFCDGFEDCSNGRDEGEGCSRFRCVDGTSVPSSFQCDGEPDCADASDEGNCGAVAMLQCSN